MASYETIARSLLSAPVAVWTVLVLLWLLVQRPPWSQHSGPVPPTKLAARYTEGIASLPRQSDTDHPTRGPTKRSGVLEIRNSTFLYMGIAERNPSLAQLARSCFPMSMAMTLTFRTKPTAKAPCGEYRFQGIYYPNSTWTTARNKLLSVAFDVERKQGWMFEFFVFMDDDVRLTRSDYPRKHFVDGEAQFQKLLLRDRPLRASVKFQELPVARNHSFLACARACYTDAAVDAYHRSGVEIFLPYNPILDRKSWWMSAYIVNLQTAAVAHKYCSLYREITVDTRLMAHSKYPTGKRDHREWKDARTIVARQLRKQNVPGYVGRLTDKKMLTKLHGPLYGSEEESCTTQPIGVNYSRLVTSGNFNGL